MPTSCFSNEIDLDDFGDFLQEKIEGGFSPFGGYPSDPEDDPYGLLEESEQDRSLVLVQVRALTKGEGICMDESAPREFFYGPYVPNLYGPYRPNLFYFHRGHKIGFDTNLNDLQEDLYRAEWDGRIKGRAKEIQHLLEKYTLPMLVEYKQKKYKTTKRKRMVQSFLLSIMHQESPTSVLRGKEDILKLVMEFAVDGYDFRPLDLTENHWQDNCRNPEMDCLCTRFDAKNSTQPYWLDPSYLNHTYLTYGGGGRVVVRKSLCGSIVRVVSVDEYEEWYRWKTDPNRLEASNKLAALHKILNNRRWRWWENYDHQRPVFYCPRTYVAWCPPSCFGEEEV